MNEKKKQDIPMDFKLDDFFTTQEQREEASKEHIENIDITLIDDFKTHPFKVVENDELKMLEESIMQNGVMSAIIVRPKGDGRYEMISGHRRKLACTKLGLNTIPCIVRDLTDDEATIFMVDSNLQREKILPSERAFAYKLKHDAMKHQGKTLDRVGPKLTSEMVGSENGDSSSQVKRFIRLTYLMPEILTMVDNKELGLEPYMAISPAVEISYLTNDEQRLLLDYMESNLASPNMNQAKNLKALSLAKKLNEDKLYEIMDVEKPNQVTNIKIKEDKILKVLPKDIERENIEDYIINACKFYSRYAKQKSSERER